MEIKIPKNSIKKLKSLGVGVVYLFGSQAQGTANSMSDIDLGIVFIDPNLPSNYKRYNKIYSELFDVFSSFLAQFGKKDIDIVPLQRAPFSIRFEAVKHGQVLYEISSEFRVNFEEFMISRYLDFKPLLEEHYHAVLERIK